MPFTIVAAEGLEADTTIAALFTRYSYTSGLQTVLTQGSDPAIARVSGTNYFSATGNASNQTVGLIQGSLPGTLQTAFANYRTISLCYAGRGNPDPGSSAGSMMGFINSVALNSTAVKLNFGLYITTSSIVIVQSADTVLNIPKSAFPSVAADAWGQVELIYVADALGSNSGVVRLYYQDILLGEAPCTIGAGWTNATNMVALRAFNVGASGLSPRRMSHAIEDDYVIAFGTDPDERLGATYISAIPPTADVSTTNWTSSDATTPLANVVNKDNPDTATPFIQTDSVGDEAIFSSSTSMPNDGRVVRSVQIRGAGQSNSTVATAQLVVNGALVDKAYNLAIDTQTMLNEGYGVDTPAPGNWLNTDPADSQPWDVTKINNLEFGVRRIT